MVEAGKAFEERATSVLSVGRDGATFPHPIDAEELSTLLTAADRLCLRLDSLPTLQRMLAQFRAWEGTAERIVRVSS